MKHDAVIITPEYALKEAWLERIKKNGLRPGALSAWDRAKFDEEFEIAFAALEENCREFGHAVTSDEAKDKISEATNRFGQAYGRAIRIAFNQMDKRSFDNIFPQRAHAELPADMQPV